MRRIATYVAWMAMGLVFVTGCDPKYDCQKNPGLEVCQYEEPSVVAQRMNTEARLFLTTFDGRAYEKFDILRKYYDEQLGGPDELDRQHLCDAEYGKLIGSFQDMFRRINVMIGDTGASLINDLGSDALGAPGYGPAWNALATARDFLPARQDLVGDEPQDLGDSISMGLDHLSDPLNRMITAATEIEKMPDCEFVLGPESLGEGVSEDEIRREYGYSNFVPLRLLANEPLDRTTLPVALEIRLGDRWDGVEARAMGSVANILTAAFHFVSAHKIEMRTDIYQIANAVGIDLSGLVTCFSERGAWYGLPAGDFDTDDNDYLSTTEECTAYYASFEFYLPDILRRLGFLFGDNPGFFAQHETRWTEYFPDIDNRMATATTELDGLFDAMAARVNEHPTDVEQERFFLYYKDSNEDGRVGIQDKVGIKLQGIKLKLPEKWITDGLGFGSVGELEDLIMQFSDILIVSMPSDSIVDDARTVLRKASASFLSVDDPNVEYSLIRLRDFQGLLYTSGLFTEVPPPDVLGLDLGAYFKNPKALRDFMPYWEVVQDSETPRNEWIIETEALMATYISTGRAIEGQVRPWERVGDSDHFRYQYEATDSTIAELLGCGSTQYIGMDADLNPNIVPDAYYCSATIASDVPRDCFGPTLTTDDSPIEYIMYIYFRDPSFNGTILTDTSTQDANEDIYEDPSGECYSPEFNGSGLIPATNFTFHRAMVAFTVWILNENKFAALLGALGG